ncbi:MAG: polysaccharide deacetylase family protein [Acidobacteriota bacterium]
MDQAAITSLATAGAAGAAGLITYAVRGRSAELLAPSIYRGDPSKPMIALTFDDGPSQSTPALLEVLAEHDVRATFFMCGRNVRRFPDIAREVLDAGHDLGNHTESHNYLHFHSPDHIYRELAMAQQSIRTVTGVRPRWFRPPYGVRWLGLRGAQRRLGLTGVMWTVIGRDWKWSGCRVARLMLSRAENGAIFCLHDGRGTVPSPDIRPTIEAVEAIVPRLKAQGYQFVTLTDMLCRNSRRRQRI